MNGSYTAKYLQSVDTILLPMQKAGSEFRRMAGSIGNIGMVVVVGKWTELSQSQVWFVPESKSPFPMFFRSDRISRLYIVSNVSVCNQFVNSILKYLNT